jgi:hypothetical protein
VPTVFTDHGFRYFFFSNEGQEPPHIHVEKGGATGKFWLNPISMAHSAGFTRTDLRRIRLVTERNERRFLEAWNAFFSQQ